MSLSYQQARDFYDNFGARQDFQIYERTAIRLLVDKSGFELAQDVFEFGSGTGALAAELLSTHLPRNARYEGVDISSTMIDLATRRLTGFGARVILKQTDGEVILRREDASCDRFVCCYVIDLLSESDASRLLEEAHRLLEPGGLICLVSLTHGRTAAARLVENIWWFLYGKNPAWVGGCRPISLKQLVRGDEWQEIDSQVVSWLGISSEVLVARKPETNDQ